MTHDAALWKEIVTASLLGTERQAPTPPAPGTPLSSLLARLDWSDQEGALLGAAATIALYQRTGAMPLREGDVSLNPPPEPVALDDLPRCTPRAAQHLALMLKKQFADVLPEWLTLCAAAHQRVAEEVLPPLLDLGQSHTELRRLITPVLGKRGAWLARQNRAWEYAVPHDTNDDAAITEIWQTGTQVTRFSLFQQLRSSDPERARALLLTTWKEEKGDDRVAFIRRIHDGLSQADEPFLEDMLDDRRKEARQMAIDLLSQLPESRFVQRMLDRVKPLLTYTPSKLLGDGRINVTPPDAYDPAMIRDGIEEKSPVPYMGDKAWWLHRILGAIPPSTWSQMWNVSPSDLLKTLKRHEWKYALLHGWIEATTVHRDEAWAEALLVNLPNELTHVKTDTLLAILSPQACEAYLMQQLKSRRNLRQARHPATYLFALYRRPWSVEFGRACLQFLCQQIVTNSKPIDLRSSLKDFARSMPPSLLEEATGSWPKNAPRWLDWQDSVDEFMAVLQFRHDMLKEFTQ